MTLNIQKTNNGFSHLTFIKILKTFTSKEMNDFEKFLISPFYNNHSTLIKIFRELKKYYPSFEDAILSKEYLFNLVNKGVKYDDMLFRKYLSRLYKLAEEYLNVIQVNSESGKKEINILIQLTNRRANDIFSKKLNETEKVFKKKNRIDVDDFLLRFMLEVVKYNNFFPENFKKIMNKSTDELYENLLNYFIFNSSSVLNQFIADKYSFKKSETLHPAGIFFRIFNLEKYIKNIKKVTDSSNKDKLLFLELVSRDLKLIPSKSGIHDYRKLKSLVYKNKENLSNQLFYYYLQRLNVFCLLENAKGKTDMSKELFENYKMLLDNNLFFLDGAEYIKFFDFRAILFSALKNKEYEWTECFINEKMNLVKDEKRVNVFHFGFSFLSFYKKNYSEALNHISKIKNESNPLAIDIYILKAKIFYMLGHFDSALSVADSFRHYIKDNNLLAEFHKEILLNFLKHFKSVIKLTLSKNKIKLKKLITELEKAVHTRERKWMLGITNDLLNKN